MISAGSARIKGAPFYWNPMAKQERSAGIIVYHIDRQTGSRLYLLLDYGKHWDFPKGHVEPGETDELAARRETLEETGLADIRFDPAFRQEIEYWFRSKSKGLIHKCVIFFIGETLSEDVTLSDEHVGHAFLPFDEACKRATYANAREVLRQAELHLRKSDGGPE